MVLNVVLMGGALTAQTPSDTTQSELPDEEFSLRRLRFGVAGGPNYAEYATSIFNSDCAFFGNASAWTSTALAFVESPLPTSLPLRLSLQLRWMDLLTSFTSGRNVVPYYDFLLSKTAETVKQHTLTTSLQGIGVSIGLLWEPVTDIRFGLDPTLIFLLDGGASQREDIIEPTEVFFTDTTRSRVVTTTTPPAIASVAFDLGMTFSLMLPVSERLSLFPQLRGSLLVTSLSSNIDWKGFTLTPTLGLAFDLTPRPERWTPPPTSPTPPIADRPHLSAAIAVRGVNEQGELYEGPVIEIEESPWSESVPIIPYVFFEPGEATIPERYVQLENQSQVDAFSLDSIIDISPLDIHWQLLNVVGRRLRSYPEATLTISGRTSGEEVNAESLERSRAEAVRDYLTVVWEIDPDRISIAGPMPGAAASEIMEDGREENRRAELRFSSPEIVRPVVIERLARIASPPSIQFLPEIIADAEVAEWVITIFQGEKELARFTGSSDRESLRPSHVWRLADTRVNRDLTPIGYRLLVGDVTGQTAEAEGMFQVTERIIRRDDSLARHRRVREYAIVGFNYDSPTLLDRHRQDLGEVAATISSDAIVSISGYTDRVGDPERNRQLSLERAQVVRRELLELLRSAGRPSPSDLIVQGHGGGAEPFDNDLPEGRILSRMVRITITR